MKLLTILTFCCLFSISGYGQITIGSNTLPELGDELEYTSFSNFQDTLSYRENGEDVQWKFVDIVPEETVYELYQDTTGNPLAQLYPSSNMILDYNGIEAAAIRTDRTIEIVGVSQEDFGEFGGASGFEFDAKINFPEPFVIRKTPFSYLEKIDDAFNVTVSISAEGIPGLDSLELPIPGAQLDSLRLSLDFTKTEEATAWGTISILGNLVDVLKIEQIDGTDTGIEIGASLFGFFQWIDAGDLLGGIGGGAGGFGGVQETTTYKFLSADSKRSILELTENRIPDTLGVTQLTVSGRISAEFLTSLVEPEDEYASVVLYPNPSSDFIHINSDELVQINKVSIYNSVGQFVNTVTDYKPGQRIAINQLRNGHYFLRIESGNKAVIKSFEVTR